MALPPSEVRLYRSAMADVDTLARDELGRAWREFNTDDAEATRDGLMDTLPGLLATYHLMAATVAADWYDLLRADTGVRGAFTAIVPDPPDTNRGYILARWGVAPLFAADPDPDVALSKVAGGVQRVVTDGARDTVTVSSIRDPAKPGWRRVGTGGCDFCRARIGIRIKNDTIFESHDACGCVAVPEF